MPDASRPLRILAFEPFDAGSHRAVRESISRHSRHRWTWITRPGRAWKWRLRLAAIEMIDDARSRGVLDQSFDAVFTTSLMSLADLRAMLPKQLRSLPFVLSMHENQAAYPQDFVRWTEEPSPPVRSPGRGQGEDPAGERLRAPKKPDAPHDVQFALTNLASILAADLTIWNSQWNKRSFLEGLAAILRHAPDSTLRMNTLGERIESCSRVIWPPVEPPPASVRPARVLHNSTGALNAEPDPIRVVWPHRWEHDKGPDELLRIAEQFTVPLNLRWTILGESFRQIPPAMSEFQRRFADRIDHISYEPDRERYWHRLASCDWVLSTARHEFFGIAVVEGLLAGCLPWLPNALSYPELLPPEAHGLSPASMRGSQANNGMRDCGAMLRERIAEHLHPAVAANAVMMLDDAVAGLMSPLLDSIPEVL